MRRRAATVAIVAVLMLAGSVGADGSAGVDYDLESFLYGPPPPPRQWTTPLTADEVSYVLALGHWAPHANHNGVALAWCESRFDYTAVNERDRGGPALGLLQLSSWWGSELPYPYGPNDDWVRRYGRLDPVRAVEDPVYNARKGHEIYTEVGVEAWGCAAATSMG